MGKETIAEKIIKKIQEMAQDDEFIKRHKLKRTYFGRSTVQISPEIVITFVHSLIKTSMDAEIERYFSAGGMNEVAPSSVTKARKKLSYTAMKEIQESVSEMIPARKTFKGFRIYAFDGMQGELPRTNELMKKYNDAGNEYPQFHAVVLYDVLNHIFISSTFEPAPADERAAAAKLIASLPENEASICTFDRGFPSLGMVQKLNEKNQYFVMRVSGSFLKEVNEFTVSEKTGENLHIEYTKRRGATSGVKNVELPYVFDLRCVKVFLKGGTVETLITNLPEEEFSDEDIAEIYRLRWGIETSFNYLKNAVKVEDFVGILENSILQEYYASLTIYNIAVICAEEAQKIYEKKNEKIQKTNV